MSDELSDEQALEILHALDKAIAEGPWEDSNFLRVIGKNLRDIRENYARLLDTLQEKSQDSNDYFQKPKLRDDQKEVFISLYSSDGNNISSWERILTNLPRHITSRPIYIDEKDAQYMIKSKENKLNEAYVSFTISYNDILPLPADKTPKDKFGKSLLSLKDRALSLENINRFVHYSGNYYFQKGRLIKLTSS